MGFFMAIIALVLAFVFKYEKAIFTAETLKGLKEFGIALL
jgi:hypothetical protein